MKYREIIEATSKESHAANKLDVEPADPRYKLYIDAIQNYTLASKGVSNLLHNMYRNNKFKTNKFIKQRIEMLDDIMYNHPLKTNLTLYHGLKENPLRIWIKYKVPFNKSVIVHMPGFTSTSTVVNKGIQFAKIDKFLSNDADKVKYSEFIKYDRKRSVLKMNVPAGTPGLSVKKYSFYPDENEILLGRGINLQIYPNPSFHFSCLMWDCNVLSVTPKEHFNENVELAEESEFQFVKAV